MTGRMTFYDEPSAWGLILGDDDRVYVVRGAQVVGTPPQVGEPVAFEPEQHGSALRAVRVRRAGAPGPRVRG
jgi:hypothetical protein